MKSVAVSVLIIVGTLVVGVVVLAGLATQWTP